MLLEAVWDLVILLAVDEGVSIAVIERTRFNGDREEYLRFGHKTAGFIIKRWWWHQNLTVGACDYLLIS